MIIVKYMETYDLDLENYELNDILTLFHLTPAILQKSDLLKGAQYNGFKNAS